MMMANPKRFYVLMVMAGLAAACGGGGQSTPEPTSPSSTSPVTSTPPSPTTTAGSGSGDLGSVTIGGETWPIIEFRCRMTDSEFNVSGSVAGPGGMRLGILVEAYNELGESQLSGPNVVVSDIIIRDPDGGSDPIVHWRSHSFASDGPLDLGADDNRKPLITSFTVDVDARTFIASGTFLNMLAGEPGNYPESAFVEGRVDARCSPPR